LVRGVHDGPEGRVVYLTSLERSAAQTIQGAGCMRRREVTRERRVSHHTRSVCHMAAATGTSVAEARASFLVGRNDSMVPAYVVLIRITIWTKVSCVIESIVLCENLTK